jgi:hypothetical protein
MYIIGVSYDPRIGAETLSPASASPCPPSCRSRGLRHGDAVSLQQHDRLEHDSASVQLRRAARAQDWSPAPAPPRLLTALVVAVAAIQILRHRRRVTANRRRPVRT